MAQTTIRAKDGKSALKIITQQYIVGTYIAYYDCDPKTFQTSGVPDQNTSAQKEDKFHQDLRKKIAKDPKVELIEDESTPMEMIKESTKKFWKENEKYDDKPKKSK